MKHHEAVIKYLVSSILLLAISIIPAMAQQTINVENPGFEQGLTGWDNNKDHGMSAVATTAAHEGATGLRVTAATPGIGGSSLAGTKFKVTPGKIYQARFWARMINGEGVGVYIVFFDAAGKSFIATKDMENQYGLLPLNIPGNQTEWKEFLIRKTAPQGAVEGQIWIHSYNASVATADLDDFHIVELDK